MIRRNSHNPPPNHTPYIVANPNQKVIRSQAASRNVKTISTAAESRFQISVFNVDSTFRTRTKADGCTLEDRNQARSIQ